MVDLKDIVHIIPLIIIGLGILISIFVEMYSKNSEKPLAFLSIVIFMSAGILSLYNISNKVILFNEMFTVGGVVNIFFALFCIGASVVVLLSLDYIKKYGTFYGEYYILIQSAVLGMMFMAGAKNLFMIFVGLELMSICFYALAGLNREKIKATESAMKYFLLGAFATGFVVYGIALIYGSSASFSIDVIASKLPELKSNYLFLTGILLFIIGFSFKIAAFPFHQWVPDVYQGTSTTVAGLFSTGGKAAAFSAIIVSFGTIFTNDASKTFLPYFAVIAVLSMLYGSITALVQSNIKRMLAYSSISHAGYMLIGLASGNSAGLAGIIFYLIAYTFMNLLAFGVISVIEGKDDSNLDIDSYTGLGRTNPLLAGLLSLSMFALAGLPPFAGFFGKYYVFISAIQNNLTWLALVGILSSVISVYFYIRLIVVMYFKEGNAGLNVEKNVPAVLGIVISALIIIALGVLPGTVIDQITTYLK